MNIKPSTMTFSIFLYMENSTPELGTFQLDGLFKELKCDDRINLIKLAAASSVSSSKKKLNSFSTCVNILYKPTNKPYNINLKLSSSGTIQITGAKSEQDPIEFLLYMHQNHNKYFNQYQAYISCCMANICYSCDYKIDRPLVREKLGQSAEFILISEPLQIYAGIIAKLALDNARVMNSNVTFIDLRMPNSCLVPIKVPFKKYYELIPERKKKKYNCKRYCTFTIFPSSNVILSTLDYDIAIEMKERFDKFLSTFAAQKIVTSEN